MQQVSRVYDEIGLELADAGENAFFVLADGVGLDVADMKDADGLGNLGRLDYNGSHHEPVRLDVAGVESNGGCEYRAPQDKQAGPAQPPASLSPEADIQSVAAHARAEHRH